MLRAVSPRKFSVALVALFVCLFTYLNFNYLFAIPLVVHGQGSFAEFFQQHFSSATSDPFQRIEFDASSNWQRKKAPNPNIAILDIDEKSLSVLGQFPFPRYLYARLLEKLKAQEAAVVAFDILFSEKERSGNRDIVQWLQNNRKTWNLKEDLFKKLQTDLAMSDGDGQLGNSLARENLPVTLGYAFEVDGSFTSGMAKKVLESLGYAVLLRSNQMVTKNINSSDYAVVDFGDYPILPNDDVLRVNTSNPSLRLGFFNAATDPDSIIRKARLITVSSQDGNVFGSLAVTAIEQYLRSRWTLVKQKGFVLSNFKGKEIPVDPYGEIYLRYYGPSKTIPTYSFVDALQGNLGDKLKGKILFVGTSALGLKDLRSNPFSASYPGVEVHATLASNILDGDFIEMGFAYYFCSYFFLFVFGLAIAYAAFSFHPLYSSLTFFLSSLALVLVGQLSFNRGIMLPYLLPSIEFFVLVISGILYRYVREEGEKKFIREAFSRYVSSSVVAELMRDRTKLSLGGEKKELTVLFCDLKGFTNFAETLDAALLSRLLNQFFTTMTSLVLDHHGTLDKYMGDALMCFWGAPLPVDKHAEKACKTALAMCRAVKTISQEWQAKYGFSVDIRVGINTGIMAVGNMGSEQVFSYTTLGDNVNLGSRLEGINSFYSTHIIVGENTFQAAKQAFCFRKLDTVLVKGKDLAVPLYELLGELDKQENFSEQIKQYDFAFQAYASGDWNKASDLFVSYLQRYPEDGAGEALLQRMAELEKQPPKDFQGVWTLRSKRS